MSLGYRCVHQFNFNLSSNLIVLYIYVIMFWDSLAVSWTWILL